MRILVLTQIIPYPPDAGPRVKTWHVLRYLAGRGHDVTLVSYMRPEESPFVITIQQLGIDVYTVPMKRSRVADVGYWLRSHFTGRPFLVERDDLKEMRQVVRDLLASELFDVIHADQLTMAQFALDVDGAGGERPFTIFDAHNAVWTIWERMGVNASWYLRPIYALEEKRIKKYEGLLVEQFSHTTAVIEPDRTALLHGVASEKRDEVAQRISVIPIAVDTADLQPVQRHSDSGNIMTLGSLHYPPNADGIRWFLKEVFPRVQEQIPEATLTIIGRNPPDDFLRAAAAAPNSISVTGYVPNLTPFMEKAALMVVPVRAGGGMRVRLLEAFARAMPAVTTTVGLEGIDASHGQEVLVADDPLGFAAETIRLVQDKEVQQILSRNGRILAETRYDWQIVLTQLDAVYELAQQARA